MLMPILVDSNPTIGCYSSFTSAYSEKDKLWRRVSNLHLPRTSFQLVIAILVMIKPACGIDLFTRREWLSRSIGDTA